MTISAVGLAGAVPLSWPLAPCEIALAYRHDAARVSLWRVSDATVEGREP
jgi:hypothetical protein